MAHQIRTFFLDRKIDCSGVSGCGKVAVGVVFENGETVLHWLGEHSSTTIYRSVQDCEFVHSHNGATKIVFDDIEEKEEEKKSSPKN